MLLDTCTFLWLATDDPSLSEPARAAIRDPSHPLYLSAASVWEIAVKYTIGKLPLPAPVKVIVKARNGSGPIGAQVYSRRGSGTG